MATRLGTPLLAHDWPYEDATMNTLTRNAGSAVAERLRDKTAVAEWRGLRQESARHLRRSVSECLMRVKNSSEGVNEESECETLCRVAEKVVAALVPADGLPEKQNAFPQPLAVYNESKLVRRRGADAGGR